jgi:hypothetical protein
MRINDDLGKPMTVDAAVVDRRRLYRVGAEVALQHAALLQMPA